MTLCHYCITCFTIPAIVVIIENAKIGLFCLYDSPKDQETYKQNTIDAFFGSFWTMVLHSNRFLILVLSVVTLAGGLAVTFELKELTSI